MISVQSDDFDVAAEYAALRDSGAGTGAIADAGASSYCWLLPIS